MPVTRRVMIATATLAAACLAAAQTQGKARTIETGLKFIDTTVGTGASPKSGQICVMHYTGWLSEGGAKGRNSILLSTADRPSSFPSA
jgi:peptidylprolyl isomerase